MSIIAQDGKGPFSASPRIFDRLVGARADLLFAMVALAVFGFAYTPNFLDLYSVWMTDPNYSHGLLVIPIAFVILWGRIAERPIALQAGTTSRVWPSVVLLAIVLTARAAAYERGSQWLETATMIPTLACLVWAIGGGRLFRAAWPALAFLVFMLPLPQNFNNFITMPLQRIATTGSCFLLQLTGLWAIQQGNVIVLDTPSGASRLDVEQACNGLKMLMTLAATVTATILLVPMPGWKRLGLLASAIPIALISNIIRIFATGWSYYLLTGEWGKHMAHDWSGFLMMPLALSLVGFEFLILSWLVPAEVEDPEDDRTVIIERIAERKS